MREAHSNTQGNTQSNDPLIVEDACLRLGGHTLFHNLSFVVAPGQTLTLMGPSGSGKSSLLHWICGTLAHELHASGRVRIGARDLLSRPAEQRRLGVLFQDDLLLPHLNVAGNLAFGLRRSPGHTRAAWRAEKRRRIAQALAEIKLETHAHAYPHQLSSGQRVRVALLRTLLCAPHALLLDEPFSRLDVSLKDRIRRFVFEHARARGLPILLVTHDHDDARAAGGTTLMLDDFIPSPTDGR